MNALPLTVPTDSLRAAMHTLDSTGKGITLVVDDAGRLLDTVTDGDLRRAVLAGLDLDGPVSSLLDRKPRSARPHPVTAPVGTDRSVLLMLLREWHVRQVPLLDLEGRAVDLVTLDDLLPEQALPVTGVVMAGGLGTRLRPLTDHCPKPMLPIGGKPLLERTLERLNAAGIRQVHLSTHYLADRIKEHFGDGSEFGLRVSYADEATPLGTAGVLGSLQVEETLLLTNGDLLTGLDYRAMLDYHREQHAELTVAVRRLEWPVPFGVVDVEGPRVTSLIEKPMATLLVNSGVYMMEPSVCRLVAPGCRCDMPEVIARLLAAGRPVAAFAIVDTEQWIDIGSPVDYERAQREVKD